MSGISVYAHIRPDTVVETSLQTDKAGTYLVLSAGDLDIFIRDREKLLELASLLEQAAQVDWKDGYRAAMNEAGWAVRELYVNHQHHTGVDGLLKRCQELEQSFICSAAPQPAEQQPAPDVSEPKSPTPKESWWAGYRAGRGLPANTPRQDAIAAPQPAEQQPVSHDWDDQDKCRRCGDRDWYASATCTPKQQSAPNKLNADREQATEVEAAPSHGLPNWSECNLRVGNSAWLKDNDRKPEYDSLTANPLHEFIYEYDDADAYKSAWFMHRLEKLIDFIRSEQVPTPDVTALVEALESLLEVQDEDCRYDHEGYCQSHNLDHVDDGCRVARAKTALAAHRKRGE